MTIIKMTIKIVADTCLAVMVLPPWSWICCPRCPLLPGSDNGLLQLVEEHLGVDTPEGVDAVSRGTPASALKREQVVVVSVSTQTLQGPTDRLSAWVVKNQLHFGHFDLSCTPFLPSVVYVGHVEDADVGETISATGNGTAHLAS